jgi:flagellar biogenesis protein FliO
MTTVVMFFTVVTAIGMSVLFGWLIRRFISPAVREEFLGRSAPAA